MTASMAEVLAAHWGHSCGLDECTCACGEPIGHWDAGEDMKAHQAHQAEALSAAGFGDVREAAAAGVRSVYEIWVAGLRSTVRMGELTSADKTILSGEWDNHIKWNMADIAKERARAANIREASS